MVGMCCMGISSALISLVVVVFPTPEKPHKEILGFRFLWIESIYISLIEILILIGFGIYIRNKPDKSIKEKAYLVFCIFLIIPIISILSLNSLSSQNTGNFDYKFPISNVKGEMFYLLGVEGQDENYKNQKIDREYQIPAGNRYLYNQN